MDKNTFILGTGCSSSVADIWMPPMIDAMAKFSISTKEEVAAFLANCGVECASFTKFEEGLNYSAQGLADTWPNRYAVDQKAKTKVPNDVAKRIARNPKAIANNVYANRMGNGDEASGDGWFHRGQGPIQVTGKENQLACMLAIDVDSFSDPSCLQRPNEGSASACWFFAVLAAATPAARAGNFPETVRRVNGQLPCPANDGDKRIARYRACLSAQ